MSLRHDLFHYPAVPIRQIRFQVGRSQRVGLREKLQCLPAQGWAPFTIRALRPSTRKSVFVPGDPAPAPEEVIVTPRFALVKNEMGETGSDWVQAAQASSAWACSSSASHWCVFELFWIDLVGDAAVGFGYRAARRMRRYWERNWQAKHLRLRKHQLRISQVNRERPTAQPHCVQIGQPPAPIRSLRAQDEPSLVTYA